MKRFLSIIGLALAPSLFFGAECRADPVSADCTYQGRALFGKIQVVKSFPDIKIQVVKSFPDLKVQWVNSFPDKCGKWQKVENFPDLKVQFVESFPDIKIEFVQSFPGVP